MSASPAKPVLESTERARAERDRLEGAGALGTTTKIGLVEQITAFSDRKKAGRRNAPQSNAPTPERLAKSEGTTHRIVGGRTVERFKTTVDLLEEREQLPRHLRQALDQFCAAYSISMGAATDERDLHGSARLVSRYDAMPTGRQPGGTEVPHRVLDAQCTVQYLQAQIPEELWPLFQQMVREETGQMVEKAGPLTVFGNTYGFRQEQQARASGATQARDICAILHLAIKSR